MKIRRGNSAAALFLALAAMPAAWACLNEVGTNNQGRRVHPASYSGENLRKILDEPTSQAVLVSWSQRVVADARKNPTAYNLTNLSAILVRFGRHEDAINLLRHIEKTEPGRYETASNIGTAYELLGRNTEALKWIEEGIRRNRDSHYGTEWLHARILKAKINPPAANGSASGKSILGLDFGSAAMPLRPVGLPKGNDGRPVTLFQLAEALRYQLTERTDFVSAPEPMVAGLFLDWANLELLAGTLESADVLYDMALKYGSDQSSLIALRKREIARVLASTKGREANDGSCELCGPPPPPPPPKRGATTGI